MMKLGMALFCGVFFLSSADFCLAQGEQPISGRSVSGKLPQISPSAAIEIALNSLPKAKPVGVKLQNEGYYMVTLRLNGSVQRVKVDSNDGTIR